MDITVPSNTKKINPDKILDISKLYLSETKFLYANPKKCKQTNSNKHNNASNINITIQYIYLRLA